MRPHLLELRVHQYTFCKRTASAKSPASAWAAAKVSSQSAFLASNAVNLIANSTAFLPSRILGSGQVAKSQRNC